MKFEQPVPLSTIAQLIGAELKGNISAVANGINEIHKVEKEDLVLLIIPNIMKPASIRQHRTLLSIRK